jgi:hypothetical protein
VLAVALLCAAALGDRSFAQSIDLSLNLFYSNPLNDQSGGTWQLSAKSAGSAGLAGLDLKLSGIVAPPAQPVGPRGTVNGSDPAGFSELSRFTYPNHVNIVVGQQPVSGMLEMDEEQSIFYGVGTIANGQPGNVGPTLATLTAAEAIPWATGDVFFADPQWNTAAILATGTFSAGATPSFFSDATFHTSGSVFTAPGTSTSVGPPMLIDSVTTIVRDNLGASPDYNGNGIVDAADYTVWRDTLNQVGPDLPADGNRNGVVDQPDYEYWKMSFGSLISPGAGSASLAGSAAAAASLGPYTGPAVPEPAVGTLLVGASGILFLRRRFRHLRNPQLP